MLGRYFNNMMDLLLADSHAVSCIFLTVYRKQFQMALDIFKQFERALTHSKIGGIVTQKSEMVSFGGVVTFGLFRCVSIFSTYSRSSLTHTQKPDYQIDPIQYNTRLPQDFPWAYGLRFAFRLLPKEQSEHPWKPP